MKMIELKLLKKLQIMSLYQCVSEIELAIYTRKVSILPDKSEATKCLDSFRIFLFSSSFVFFVCLFFSLQIGIGRLTFWILCFLFQQVKCVYTREQPKNFLKKIINKKKADPPPLAPSQVRKSAPIDRLFLFFIRIDTQDVPLFHAGGVVNVRARNQAA